MARRIVVAIAGNPNAGKTCIFNALTGARQHVGNYPGVTVEKYEGVRRHGDIEFVFVDLPGTYSLSAWSPEERAARRFLLEERPDVVVDVVDASNLERNLYLTVQLMELGLPLVLAFNMSDVARAHGLEFDLRRLSALFRTPIVPTVGHRGEGMEDLLAAIVAAADAPRPPPLRLSFTPELDAAITRIAQRLRQKEPSLDPWWLALKLFEQDAAVRELVQDPALWEEVQRESAHIERLRGMPVPHIIAETRYGFISGACQEAARSGVELRHHVSDAIDSVVTHRILGFPIFLGMMYLVFFLTFRVGEPLMSALETAFVGLGDALRSLWPGPPDSPLLLLLVDGVVAGVGSVLAFLPNILLLFLAIAFLEDSGYMARAAFIMDRLMHKIGLHGRSVIPMLIGFGCTVPAVMATRVIESRRDRLTTILVLPLISCSARLPIYMLILPSFFPARMRAPMLWGIYLLGVALAAVAARLLRGTIFRGESEPFVMELPPYRMPTWRSLVIHMWQRTGMYLRKAGTLILAISVLMWILSNYPRPKGVESPSRADILNHSLAGRLGRHLEPILRPLGFDWRIGTAIIGAFAAKEVFVAQLGIVFATETEELQPLREALARYYSPLTGLCVMLFMLIAMPCAATLAIVSRESGSWKWALFQTASLTSLAYVLTLLVYQVGRLLGLGA